MIVLRPLAHLLGVLWAIVLAAIALGIALFCLDGLVSLGSARPDRLLHLAHVRERVGRFLAQLEAPGHIALLSALCGLAAIIAGLAIVWALLGRSRGRTAVLAEDGEHGGVLAIRVRPLAQMLRVLAAEPREALAVKRVDVALARRGPGGRVRVRALRAPGGESRSVSDSLERALEPLAAPFALRPRVRVRVPREARGASRSRGKP